jgi:hypothetical protein
MHGPLNVIFFRYLQAYILIQREKQDIHFGGLGITDITRVRRATLASTLAQVKAV